MSGRKTFVDEATKSHRNAGAFDVAHQPGGLSADECLVDSTDRGRGYLSWSSGLATLKGQMVKHKSKGDKQDEPENE